MTHKGNRLPLAIFATLAAFAVGCQKEKSSESPYVFEAELGEGLSNRTVHVVPRLLENEPGAVGMKAQAIELVDHDTDPGVAAPDTITIEFALADQEYAFNPEGRHRLSVDVRVRNNFSQPISAVLVELTAILPPTGRRAVEDDRPVAGLDNTWGAWRYVEVGPAAWSDPRAWVFEVPNNSLFTLTGEVYIVANDEAPVADAGGPYSVNPPSDACATEPGPLVTFDASASSDPDPDDALTYQWDLDGDGDYSDATGRLLPMTYRQLGVFGLGTYGQHVIGLKTVDSAGLESLAQAQVNVANIPIAVFGECSNNGQPCSSEDRSACLSPLAACNPRHEMASDNGGGSVGKVVYEFNRPVEIDPDGATFWDRVFDRPYDVELSVDGCTATFTPERPIGFNFDYEMELSPGAVVDAGGNPAQWSEISPAYTPGVYSFSTPHKDQVSYLASYKHSGAEIRSNYELYVSDSNGNQRRRITFLAGDYERCGNPTARCIVNECDDNKAYCREDFLGYCGDPETAQCLVSVCDTNGAPCDGRLTPIGKPQWASDGLSILISLQNNNEPPQLNYRRRGFYRYDFIDGSLEKVEVAPGIGVPAEASPSPDNRLIAFTGIPFADDFSYHCASPSDQTCTPYATCSDNGEICLIENVSLCANPSTAECVDGACSDNGNPCFADDRRQCGNPDAATCISGTASCDTTDCCTETNRNRVFVMNAETGETIKITGAGVNRCKNDYQPNFSPNGRFLAFSSGRFGRENLFRWEVDPNGDDVLNGSIGVARISDVTVYGSFLWHAGGTLLIVTATGANLPESDGSYGMLVERASFLDSLTGVFNPKSHPFGLFSNLGSLSFADPLSDSAIATDGRLIRIDGLSSNATTVTPLVEDSPLSILSPQWYSGPVKP